ncbi:MAG: Rieske 2Fe-2S domain-containing protein [Kiloniellales bacterium]|jgi:toluene monooxygenase system ferredoxin subunit|nr:Rieske 2Fe-2S domain-containing protein [Kiloniellales bacterium]
MSSWKKACAVSDVPVNELRQFSIDGIDVVVANHGDGFRAFPPFCPHMQEPLVESGMLDKCVLTCAKHLWQWNLASGERVGISERDMLFYDVKEEDGALLVDLESELVYDWEEEDEMDDDDFFGSD